MPKLTGVFHHILEPGGDGPAFALTISSIDVDASAISHIGDFNGKSAYVSGNVVVRHYVERGAVLTLVAQTVSASEPHVLYGDTVLAGTIKTGILGPGGETTGVILVGIEAALDISKAHVDAADIEQHLVLVDGAFELVKLLPPRTLWVLNATSVTPIGAVQSQELAAVS